MSKAVQPYKRASLDGPWDAIVIGSGIGGLTVAAVLAKEGRRVLVLERHYEAGGFTHVFRRPGYEWDVGIHYIGGLSGKPTAISQVFDYISDRQLQWADIGEVYDRVAFGDERFEFHKGTRAFVEHLQQSFPQARDREAIERYVELVRSANAASRGFFAEKAVPRLVAGLLGGRMRKPFLQYARRTTRAVLEELTDNPKLIGVLTAQFGDYGLPPSESSFAMHAMVAGHYFGGGAFPVGGSSRIAASVAEVIAAAGGQVVTSAEVAEIIVEGNKAVGVRMEDGRELSAPRIVSGAGVHNTFGRLLPETVRGRHGLAPKSESFEPSAAHLSLYLGFRKTAQQLQLPKANWWIFPDGAYDHDANIAAFFEDESRPLPLVYVSFPSAKDPSWEERHPGTATVDVITLARYERFAPWVDERWKNRGDEYEALKQSYVDRLLEVLYRYEPQLRGLVDHAELSTPVTTRHFTDYRRGEIYGLTHTPDRFESRLLAPRTPVQRLYLTGQDIATCGVAGAMMSGVMTASAMLGRDVLGRIRRGAGASS